MKQDGTFLAACFENEKMKRFFTYCLLALPLMFSVGIAVAQTDIFDKITAAMKSGNSHNVAAFFDTSVEMKLIDKSAVYSKNQAEMVLKSFFEKNHVKNFTIIHRGTSTKGARYAIGNLETSQGSFRTYFFVKEISGTLTIQQLNIENQ